MPEHGPSPVSDLSPDLSAIGKLIREELDRNNKYLDFAQTQIGRDREFYKHLYTIAAAFIALMVGIAGYFTYTNVSQMRSDVKASLDAQVARSQAEIDAIRAQATAASVEAQATVTRELANVRTEVQKRIDDEFKTENITALVEAATKSKTEKEFAGIVQTETSKQVATAISAQQPMIQKAVQDQTTAAVKALEPTISSVVAKEMESQVQHSISPITTQMKDFGDLMFVERLATLAKSNDRKAFDQLLEIANRALNTSSSPTDDMRKVAASTVADIINHMLTSLRMSLTFIEGHKPPPDTLRAMIRSPVAQERLAALDNYPDTDNRILPILIDLIQHDDNLQVVDAAMKRFNGLTKQNIHFPMYDTFLAYWTANSEVLMKDVK